MKQDARIVITGFMAAGKTFVAEALARLLGCSTVDLDRKIATREGRRVCDIIEENGEAFFRLAETRALENILENDFACIIALGGGAWAVGRNRSLIAKHKCRTVWLDAPFEVCWQRIAIAAREGEEIRPLARDYAAAKKLYEQRRAFYALAEFRMASIASKTAEIQAAEIAALCGEKSERI